MKAGRNRLLLLALTGVSLWAQNGAVIAAEPCRIEVVEKGTGWPVPLVELRTVHHVRFVSDNAGLIAFDLPELMGRETWFDVIGHGYEVPKDGNLYPARMAPSATLLRMVCRLPSRAQIGVAYDICCNSPMTALCYALNLGRME